MSERSAEASAESDLPVATPTALIDLRSATKTRAVLEPYRVYECPNCSVEHEADEFVRVGASAILDGEPDAEQSSVVCRYCWEALTGLDAPKPENQPGGDPSSEVKSGEKGPQTVLRTRQTESSSNPLGADPLGTVAALVVVVSVIMVSLEVFSEAQAQLAANPEPVLTGAPIAAELVPVILLLVVMFACMSHAIRRPF